jgi:hypothetical protein
VAKWMTESAEWTDKKLASTVRGFSKWYFDLIKNAFVVVALWYASGKTGDATVGVVAKLTSGVFVAYTFSYPLEVHYAISRYGRTHSPLLSLFIRMLSGFILLGLVVTVTFAVTKVLGALFTIQGLRK